MEQAPFTFKTALTEAEASAHKILCEILGFQSGKNAFIGINDGKKNTFVFSIGAIRNGEVTHSGRCEHFHFQALGEAWFDVREDAQELIMRLLAALPVDRSKFEGTNLITLRLATNGVSAVDVVDLQQKGEQKELPFWHVAFEFDVVFYTGKRPGDNKTCL